MAKRRISKRRYVRENLRLMLSLSRSMRARLEDSFKYLASEASKEYKLLGLVSRDYYDQYFDELYKIFSNQARIVIDRVNINMKRDFDVKGDEIIVDNVETPIEPISPYTQEYIQTETAQHVTQVTQTTKRQIQRAIEFSVSEGFGVVATAQVIEDSTAFSATRAKLIARTETHSAMGYGAHMTAKTLNLKSPKKSWLSANDARTRDWHKVMNTREPIPIDDDFILNTPKAGGGSVPRPMSWTGDSRGGALNVINCRCTTLYHDIDTILED